MPQIQLFLKYFLFIFPMRKICFFLLLLYVCCHLRIRIPMSPLGNAVKRVSADAIEHKNYAFCSLFAFPAAFIPRTDCVGFSCFCCCCRVTKPVTFHLTHFLHYAVPDSRQSASQLSTAQFWLTFLLLFVIFLWRFVFINFFYCCWTDLEQTVTRRSYVRSVCNKRNARKNW